MNHKYLYSIGLTCLALLITAMSLQAQKPGSRRWIKKYGKPQSTITENLPTFFANDVRLPDYLKKVYEHDAARLALRLISKEIRLTNQTVKIPEELEQAVYNALVKVRTSDYAAINTIAEKYNVRTFPAPNVNNIILLFEHDDPRLEYIRRYRRDTTGDPHFNNIMRKHNLRISRLAYLDEERAALILEAREPINTTALAYQFFTTEGIGSMEEVLPYGDGNDIEVTRTTDGWELSYSVKFGNCTNQCQKQHDWKFEVSNDGDVVYHGESGQVIPPWVSPAAHLPKDVLKK